MKNLTLGAADGPPASREFNGRRWPAADQDVRVHKMTQRVRPLAIALGLLLGAASVYSGEPLEFKGLRIGSAPEELRRKYPELHCNDPKMKAAVEKGHFRDFWERKQTEADLFCATVINDRDPPTALSDIAGHRARSFDFNFLGARLMRASTSLPSIAFGDVVRGLTAKYGPPDKTDTEQLQNRMGATFTNVIHYWRRDGATLRLSEYSGSLDTASYSLTSDEYWAEVEKRRTERARSSVKSL